MIEYEVIDTQISPEGRMEVLSKAEVGKLLDNSHGGLYQIFRSCALAVLNCGTGPASMRDGNGLNCGPLATCRRRVRGETNSSENGSVGLAAYSMPGNSLPGIGLTPASVLLNAWTGALPLR